MKWYKKLPKTSIDNTLFAGIIMFIFLFVYHMIYVRPIWEWLTVAYDFSEKLPYSLYTNLITSVGALYGLFAVALAILSFFGFNKLKTLNELQEELKNKFFLIEAEVLYEREKNDEAWEAIQQLSDNDWEICLYKGLIKTRTHSTNESLNYYSKALTFDECDKAEIYLNRSLLYIQLAEDNPTKQENFYRLALGDLKEALAIKGNLGSAYSRKSYIIKRLESLEKAL